MKNIDKNQTPNSLDGKNLNSLDAQNSKEKSEIQKRLHDRIAELQQWSELTKKEVGDLKKEVLPFASLKSLENRVNQLDTLGNLSFDNAVKRIEAELDVLEESRRDFSDLQKGIRSQNPELYASLINQLPESSEQANKGRAFSYEAIATIKPKEGENPIANFFAGVIEKLLA